MLGVFAAPAGQIGLQTGGSRSAPTVPRSIGPAGAAGTPEIDEMNLDFEINSKINIDFANVGGPGGPGRQN